MFCLRVVEKDVLKFCMNRDTVSVSLLQRKFGMGYARAGRIVDDLERLGIVSRCDKKDTRLHALTKFEAEKISLQMAMSIIWCR